MKRILSRLGMIAALSLIFYFFVNGQLNQLYSDEQASAENTTSLIDDQGWVNVEKIASQKESGRPVESELFFLLLGVDENDGQSGDYTRTDTMMLVKLDFEEGSIDLISLPRDSRVLINGEYTKLNHAHSLGGIDLTMETIRNWLDIDLDYYVEMDFEAVRDLVDAIGGVEYTVPDIGQDYIYTRTDGKKASLEPGKQVLDGEEALGYVRYRKGYVQGDIGRIQAQQNFMKSLVEQMLDQKSIGQIPSYINVYFDDIKTNIPWSEILGLLGQINNLQDAKLQTHTIPGQGEYIDNISYYVVDPTGTKELIQELLANYRILEFGNN